MTRHPRGRAALPGWLPLVLVCALGVAPYRPTLDNGFVGMDDDAYIYENPQVLRGLTGEGVLWALTSTEHANWYPLRRLSHLVDASLFGMWAGGHHLVSAAWHAGAAALLFLALRQMTGALWRSFAVAGLFAAHPLQAESVAWAAERSNVQAGFFFALTLLLWARYVRRPGGGRYAAALAACALGLAAKPTLVPLPLLLLLLDFWPLGRVSGPGGPPRKPTPPAPGRLLLEKAPLFALAAVSGSIAIVAHRQAKALESLETLPAASRIANAALSYWRYLGKFLWPVDLAAYYPHPGRDLPLGLAAVAGLALVALTALAFLQARRRPWLAVGWLWYLGMLLPTSGVVQFSGQAMADRFAYLPSAGFFVLLVWSAAAGLPPPLPRPAALIAAPAVLAALSAATLAQARIWKDSVSLFTHTLGITADNWYIENNLGMALLAASRPFEAIEHFRQAERLHPRDARLQWNLAAALSQAGRHEEALAAQREAVRLRPSWTEAHLRLGNVLVELGRYEEAAPAYEEVLRQRPSQAEAHINLGNVLFHLRRYEEAAVHYREVIRARPGSAEAHGNLGVVLAQLGRLQEADVHRREAERLRGAQRGGGAASSP